MIESVIRTYMKFYEVSPCKNDFAVKLRENLMTIEKEG